MTRKREKKMQKRQKDLAVLSAVKPSPMMSNYNAVVTFTGKQCLLDSYELTECPVCTHHIACTTSSGTQQVLCTLHNEGGLQENLDILPLLTEESYLKAYPEERKARAFLEFCREGDVDAIVDLLKAVEDDSEEEEEGPQMSPSDILRYQDPTGSLHSGLHIAVMSGQVGVIWLLLWITSSLEVYKFPIELFRAAEEHAMGREDLGPNKMDIRALTDASGVMAVHYADPHTLAGFNVDYLTPP
ncbi:MAG: hypothetical protein MMC33_002695 [Icmadophila ericetorum]|nr:hypothetical protein [Icmadophila ericetorum]